MARKTYSTIVIIYNPNSTGNSRQKAEETARAIKDALPGTRVRLSASKKRGHMESMAYRTALLSRHALIIAVSGDGGYNEVINGALRAQRARKRVTVGLVPAGNANDHYAGVHRGDLIKRIAAADEDVIDVLEMSGRGHRGTVKRYGHSYIGVGLTPQAGEKLNQIRLNVWRELKIVFDVLSHFKSVKLLVDGTVVHYDSLVFANTKRMSKFIRLAKDTSVTDGKFEIGHVYRRNKLKLIAVLARAATLGLEADERASSYEFETLRATPVQVDGEIVKLAAGTRVSIVSRPRLLHCIV